MSTSRKSRTGSTCSVVARQKHTERRDTVGLRSTRQHGGPLSLLWSIGRGHSFAGCLLLSSIDASDRRMIPHGILGPSDIFLFLNPWWKRRRVCKSRWSITASSLRSSLLSDNSRAVGDNQEGVVLPPSIFLGHPNWPCGIRFMYSLSCISNIPANLCSAGTK